jgi:hypothetical protein
MGAQGKGQSLGAVPFLYPRVGNPTAAPLAGSRVGNIILQEADQEYP